MISKCYENTKFTACPHIKKIGELAFKIMNINACLSNFNTFLIFTKFGRI